MKKSLLICLFLINHHCLGMTQAFDALFGGIVGARALPSSSTELTNHPTHWTEALNNQQFEDAIELLKIVPAADANKYALIYLAKSSMPLELLATILSDLSYQFSEENFFGGMQIALKKGDLELYELFHKYSMLSLKYRIKLVVFGRIDAAAGNYRVMKWFLTRGKEAREEIERKEILQNQVSSREDKEIFERLWNISRRLRNARRPQIWDGNKRKFVERGTKAHTLSLHAAVDCKAKDIVILLLQFGANVDVKDHEGETALQIAKRRKFAGITRILELYAKYHKILLTFVPRDSLVSIIKECPGLASCFIKDRAGNTLLHHAVNNDEEALIHVLNQSNPHLIDEPNHEGELPTLTKVVSARSSQSSSCSSTSSSIISHPDPLEE